MPIEVPSPPLSLMTAVARIASAASPVGDLDVGQRLHVERLDRALGDHAGLAVLEQPVVVREDVDRDVVHAGLAHLLAREREALRVALACHASIVGCRCADRYTRRPRLALRDQVLAARKRRPLEAAAGLARVRRRRRARVAEPVRSRRHRRGVRLGRQRARHRPPARRARGSRQARPAAGACCPDSTSTGPCTPAASGLAPARARPARADGAAPRSRRDRAGRRRPRAGPRPSRRPARGSARAAGATTAPCRRVSRRHPGRRAAVRRRGRARRARRAPRRAGRLRADVARRARRWALRSDGLRSALGRREHQGVLGRGLHGPAGEGPGQRLAVDVELGLVGVVRRRRVAGDAGEVDPPRVVESASETTIRIDGAAVTSKPSTASHDVASTIDAPPPTSQPPRLKRRSTGPTPDSPSVGLCEVQPVQPAPRPTGAGRGPGGGSSRRGRRCSAPGGCRRGSRRRRRCARRPTTDRRARDSSSVTTREPAVAAVGPGALAAARRGRSAAEQVAPHHVEVGAAAGLSAGCGEVPAAQQRSGRRGSSRTAALDVEQVGHQRRRPSGWWCRAGARPSPRRDSSPSLSSSSRIRCRAVAVVPVLGEEVGVALVDDGLVGRHDEALVRVEHAGQRRRTGCTRRSSRSR